MTNPVLYQWLLGTHVLTVLWHTSAWECHRGNVERETTAARPSQCFRAGPSSSSYSSSSVLGVITQGLTGLLRDISLPQQNFWADRECFLTFFFFFFPKGLDRKFKTAPSHFIRSGSMSSGAEQPGSRGRMGLLSVQLWGVWILDSVPGTGRTFCESGQTVWYMLCACQQSCKAEAVT